VTQYEWLHPGAMHVLDVEPEFVLAYVRGIFPEFVDLVTEALEPAAEHIPAVHAGTLMLHQVAEVVQRAWASTVFVPSDHAENMPRWVEPLIAGR